MSFRCISSIQDGLYHSKKRISKLFMISRKLLLLFLLINTVVNAQPPKTYSSSEILLQLKKLKTLESVLYIAAHPDDENTRLISYLVNEKHLRTGYLSLTRGDGGQNLIGPEQGVELGLIRTQELLAARRTDGGEQFFTRAYDFGYSKTPEETLEKWNRDSILADMVWIIRKFRPDIIITRFATDGSGGHGHHTTSALLAEEAFDAAADPTRFMSQLAYVSVWKTKRLLHNSTARFRDPKADMTGLIKLDVGGYNALLGKSYGEISAESRSMHKSQGFGSARQRGELLEYFKPIKGDTMGLQDIFQGINLTWNREPNGKAMDKLLTQCISKFDINNPNSIAPLLFKVQFQMIKDKHTEKYAYKMDELDKISMACAGLVIDITSNEPQICSECEGKLTFSAINRSNEVIKIERLFLPGRLKNAVSRPWFDTIVNLELLPNKLITFTINIKPFFEKDEASVSQPYWLKEMPNGMFHSTKIFDTGTPEIGFNNNVMVIGYFKNTSSFIANVSIQHRWVDPEKGELYRPMVITPPVIINLLDEINMFTNDKPKEVRVRLRAMRDNTSGSLNLKAGNNWIIEPSKIDFTLNKKGEEQILVFKISSLGAKISENIKVNAVINGQAYTKDLHEIKYDHIPVQTWFPEAEGKLIHTDVVMKKRKIGYIPGAGDEVQNCLQQLGYEVTTITNEMLSSSNLNVYECIITGVRAYNTNELLSQKKQKLLDYVNQGGNLIVQYNTNSWAGPIKGNFGPYPFKITRERVTDENAEIKFELPEHPVLNFPNKLGADDFKGWVQERGIYFAGEIDSVYDCPVSMGDKGEKPNKGSLIITKVGKGHFIYTGIAFFRQLPAGVPGAYRFFTNLIEL